MPTALGFGPIKDDDELLDRLGSRSSEATDGLEGLFASWTASIDEDERVGARDLGPLGLRLVGDAEEPAAVQRTRVVKVPRTRAVALVGALALTLSGGGVAAALSQAEADIVTKVIQKATEPIAASLPQIVAHPIATTSTSASTPTADAAWEMVQKAREAAGNGEVQKAIGMMEVIRSLAPKDPVGEQITAQVDALERSITRTAPVVVADAPKKATSNAETPGTAPTSARSTQSSSATSAPVSSPTSSSSTDKPSPSKTADPSSPTSTQSPTQTPATTAPTVGNAGGEQSAGTSSPVSEATKAPETSGGESKPTTRPITKPTTDSDDAEETAPDLAEPSTAGTGASVTAGTDAVEDATTAE